MAATEPEKPDSPAIWRPRMTPYIRPGKYGLTMKQQLLLCLSSVLDVLFGGAVGGGKTWSILAAGLQYVDIPGYSALIIRRTRPEMIQPGGILHLAHEMLAGTDAAWSGQDNCFRFPSGATLTFGHMEDAQTHLRYKGGEYQYIGYDEATDILPEQLAFVVSRLRRRESIPVPERVRYASNPGGVAHAHLKNLFIDSPIPGKRVYLPSRLSDNPYLEQETYLKRLSQFDPITRERLINGDWSVRKSGMLFKREWFPIVDHLPPEIIARVRGWDLAASTSEDAKRTAGILVARTEQDFFVEDCKAGRWSPGERDEVIREIAARDGHGVVVAVEQEPGSGGLAQNDALVRLLFGHTVRSRSPSRSGDKFVRAAPFASAAENKHVFLVRGAWNEDYLDELEAADPSRATDRQYLDRMDGSSLAFAEIAPMQTPTVTGPSNVGQIARTFATGGPRRIF